MKSFAEWPLTRRARRLPVWIPALLLGVTLLTSIVSPATAVAGEPLDIPYPRFGMAIPSFGSSAASRAAYDFMVLQHDQLNMIAGLRTANPDIIVLGWTNAMELWFSTGSYDHVFNQELRSASSDWMFTEAGTTLRTAITTSVAPGSTLTETIALPAGAGSMFRADDAVLIGGTPGSGFTGDSPMRRTTEIARVVSVSGDTLTVARGEFWPTKTHAAGTRIAALTSAWSRHIEMDVRDACPAVDVGYGLERWQDFNARRGYDVMHAPDTLGQRFDGLHIDAFGIDPGWALFNNQFIATFDPNRTNTSYTDKATFYPAWNVGLGHYAEKLRTLCGPDAILHPNGSNRFYDALNGFMQETFPTTSTSLQLWNYVVNEWYQTSAPGDWQVSLTKSAANALRPNINSIATKTINLGSGSNYQLMRFGLCTILMTDGFFVPVAGWNWGETNLLWFDEFGGSGGSAGYECTSPLPRGYLGQPTGDRYMIGTSNVWRRDYEGGIALVNPDSVARTVSLGGTFRKIKGTQAPTVNDGSLVTEVTLQPRDGIVLLREGNTPPADTTAPSVPSGVTATALSTTSIQVSWNASSDASGIREYRVYMNGSLKTTVTGTSTTVTGLVPATSYSFTVLAVDNAGNASAQSGTAIATTQALPDTTAPSVPSGVTATALSTTSIQVSWNASSDASGIREYRVYMNGSLKTTVTGTSTTVTGLVPATSYSFTVLAVDNAGNASAQSGTAIATTQALPDTTAPSVPSGVTATALSTTSIQVSWNASSDASGIREYRVYMNGSLKTTVTGTSTTVTGLVPATSYSFTVLAVDNAGNASAQSGTAIATTQALPDTTAPSVPSGVTATALSTTSIQVSWNASSDDSGVSSYRVYRDGVLASTVMDTTATLTELTAETTYSVCVVAVDAAGNASAKSETIVISTPMAPDSIAPAISASGVVADKVYTAPVTITYFAVDTGSGLAAGYPVATLDGQPFLSGSVVSAVGSHTLIVTARDRMGNASSRSWSFTIDEPVVKVKIRGKSRIHTAVEASAMSFDAAESVVIATGANWPDALGGSALAGALDAPILLTATNTLPGEVRAEIVRLGARRVYILGGTPAVSARVFDAIGRIPGVAVERIAGVNRFETANKVAAKTIEILRSKGDYDGRAFVVTGANFPDALAVAPLAAANGWPIYLASPNQGSNAALVATMRRAGVKSVVVLGSTRAVSNRVASALGPMYECRLSGSTRYETALAVAEYGIAHAGLAWDKVAIATGEDFPDALAGGVLQGRSNSVMLLTKPTALNQGVAGTLAANRSEIDEVRFLGPVASLSDGWAAD